ncbi:MAG: DEAD/DEAH box helicase family protein, partial [Verrucomicrobia bacterium]|nr:DEAD/DEAH box helicase family protein [Verrucomicrobiota bacterium]
AVEAAGWDIQTQMREEVYLTDGRIKVRNREVSRGERKRADYVLYYKPNLPIAVIEAKDNKHSVGSGMQQGLDYSGILDVPFAYSSNGDAFLEHDRTATSGSVETELPMDKFPSPEELWNRYCAARGMDDPVKEVVEQESYTDTSEKSLRYYQEVAVNRSVEAIAKGRNRLLLVMATGTGKTFTAFHIIWRLWKARKKKRILFLADRNILVDQAKINDFKPFGSAMTKISKRQVDKSYEIYLCLYQAITGTEEEKNIYKQFSPDFFDLIVVDECHRGSAAADSAWREVLEYFKSATQIGMTATPKETESVSNIDYFGEPIYTYSLRQGIDDGFLAPYRVIRVDLDKDLKGWEPKKGQLDKHGRLIEARKYNQRDFDRTLVLEKRTELVAQTVTDFLKANDEYGKTIVFCEDIEHAERMRQALVNQNPERVAENEKHVMRITGDESLGKAELDNFIDPEQTYPVIVTTSQLLSTGVDAQTCKLIVLDQRIESKTRFKQIIGRGTRIREDFGKQYFTILDFRGATQQFFDPEFDGEPLQDEKFGYDKPSGPRGGGRSGEPKPKYYVDDVPVEITAKRVQFIGPDGKLITESLRDYTKKNVQKEYESLDDFLKYWSDAERKQIILRELQDHGVFLGELADEVGKDYDPFDLVCHVAFDQPPLTRRERVENVRKRNYFTKYGDKARVVLDALLEKYADEGLEDLESIEVLRVQPINELGTPVEIIEIFGGKEQYWQAVKELENELYKKTS